MGRPTRWQRPPGRVVARCRRPGLAAPAVTVVLDSEALSSLATPGDRSVARRRAAAVLAIAAASGSRVIVPAPALAEVGRSVARQRSVDAAIAGLTTVPTDRRIAQRAGLLLGRSGASSVDAIDAFVASTAAERPPALVLTTDVDDLSTLCADIPNVEVRYLH